MTVYVDQDRFRTGKNGRVRYCHMTADTIEELHGFARKIGVNKCWFETSRSGIPHYDLNATNRGEALRHGALEWQRATKQKFKKMNPDTLSALQTLSRAVVRGESDEILSVLMANVSISSR
jgi:hypothetical protein